MIRLISTVAPSFEECNNKSGIGFNKRKRRAANFESHLDRATKEMNYSRIYNDTQTLSVGAKAKAVGKAKLALDPSGKPNFVAADTVAPRKPRKPAWTAGKVWSICAFRLKGIERLIEGRHRGPCDTDDGESYFSQAVIHLVARRVAKHQKDDTVKSLEWAQRWTPALVAEKGRAWFDEQESKLLIAFDCRRMPALPSADDVADALGVKQAEIEAYALKTIGATDRRKNVRRVEAKAKNAEGERNRRKKDGATPQAGSMARTKPWEALGMSRATYYRAVDRGEIQPHERMQKGAGKPTKSGNVLRVIRAK